MYHRPGEPVALTQPPGGVVHQTTSPPQSADINEIVWLSWNTDNAN